MGEVGRTLVARIRLSPVEVASIGPISVEIAPTLLYFGQEDAELAPNMTDIRTKTVEATTRVNIRHSSTGFSQSWGD